MSDAVPAGVHVWLCIGDEATRLSVDGDRPTELRLPLGAELAARRFFRHAPPTPLELEHAIEAVEDAVMPLRAQLPAGAALASRDAALWALARHAGVEGAAAVFLSLEAVERLFDRLAARAAGRPAPQDALPVDGASAARLLILREALHHWGLDGVTLSA